MRKDRRVVRAAIVRAAAKRLGCTIREMFIRATKDAQDLVVNLNKIPECVVAYAREVLKSRFRARPLVKHRQRYYRAAPFMNAR